MKRKALLLICASYYATASALDCAIDGAVGADDDNCAGYFQCQKGEAVPKQCPFGLFFNSGKITVVLVVFVCCCCYCCCRCTVVAFVVVAAAAVNVVAVVAAAAANIF